MNRNTITRFFVMAALLGVLTAVGARAGDGDWQVIVNSGAGETTVSRADLKDILLGRKKMWQNGTAIQLSLVERNDAVAAAIRELTGKSMSQFDVHWKRLMFSGQATVPEMKEDAGAIVDSVLARKGGLAIVPAGTDLKGAVSLTLQ